MYALIPNDQYVTPSNKDILDYSIQTVDGVYRK